MPNPRSAPMPVFCIGTSASNHMTVGIRPSATGTNPGRLELRLAGPFTHTQVSDVRIDNNEWRHIALQFRYQFETTVIEMFIDGKPDKAVLAPKEFVLPSTWKTTLLGESKFITGYQTGQMDEIAVFNKPLSNERIAAHSSLTKPNIELDAKATVDITANIGYSRTLLWSLTSHVLASGNVGLSLDRPKITHSLTSKVTYKGNIDYALLAKPIVWHTKLAAHSTETILQRREHTRL